MSWQLTTTITIPELAFTLIAALGVAVLIWNAIMAFRDVNYETALRVFGLSQRNQTVRLTAWMILRGAVIGVFIQLLFFLAGVYALTEAPRDPDRVVRLGDLIMAAAIIGAELLLVAMAVLDLRDRRRIQTLLVHDITEKLRTKNGSTGGGC